MGFRLLAIVGDTRDDDHRRSLVALDLDLGEGPQLWSGAGPLRKGILKTANLVTSVQTKKQMYVRYTKQKEKLPMPQILQKLEVYEVLVCGEIKMAEAPSARFNSLLNKRFAFF